MICKEFGGWRCARRKFSFQQLDGTLLGHIYSYVCQENKSATFTLQSLYQLDYRKIKYCFTHYVSSLEDTFNSLHQH